MKNFRRTVSAFLCMLIVFGSSVTAFASVGTEKPEETTQSADAQTQSAESVVEKIIDVRICANKGDWRSAPENSERSVTACSCDYVSVDVRVTSDGVPVLMEDEIVDRTCVDEQGKPVTGKVSEMTLDKIKTFRLRDRNGGPHNGITDCTVPTLADIFNAAGGKTLILDFYAEDLDKVYEAVYDAGYQKNVIFRITGDTDDVVSALRGKKTVPETIIKYDGNIIFSVNSAIDGAKNAGLHFVQLGTKNQYGVIFYKNVEDRIKDNGLTAVFSMTDGYNGKRGDNISGWDDVISHGYSVIETDYPDLLQAYVSQSALLRERLVELTAEKDEYVSGTYPKNLLDEYNKAYDTAVSYIDSSASQSQLAQAYTDLDSARNALDLAEGQNTSQSVLNFSTGRIIAAVLCLAAVVAAQIFFYKRRK